MSDQTDQSSTPAETAEGKDPASLDDALGTPGALMDEIADELGAVDQPPETVGDAMGEESITPMVLDELEDSAEAGMSMRDMRMLADIDVEVAVEFGRARLELRDLLSLRRGSLVELSRGLDQPVGILANNTLVAYGEIVMVGDRFGVHVLEIVDPADRVKAKRLERTNPGVAVEHHWAEHAADDGVDTDDDADGESDADGDATASEG